MDRLTHLIFLNLLATTIFSQFENITERVNMVHHHLSPTLIGGGIAFIDVNNDGWEDLYMTGGSLNDILYLNDQGKNLQDVSAEYIAPYIRSGTQNSGVVVGDFDNDGWDDLFITTLSDGSANYLLRNSKEGFFIDISNAAGIIEKGPSTGAALMDVNDDGFLDIYVINYVEEVVFIRDSTDAVVGFDHICFPNYLYINNGDMTFTEMSASLDVAGIGCGLAVTGADFLDTTGIYVANDYGEWVQENELFLVTNDSDSLCDQAAAFGLDIALYGMGIAIGDIDNDLDFDLYITNIGSNALLINDQKIYSDRAKEWGVSNQYVIEDSLLATGWGAIFLDYNNDSYQDLYVANGYIPSSRFIPTFFLDPNKLYKNIGGGFRDFSEAQGVDFLGVNRGVISGDFDLDGDLDLVVSTVVAGEPTDDNLQKSQFYANLNLQGNYLRVDLEGSMSNRNAYGAKVVCFVGDNSYMQLVYSSGTHASQSSQYLHFGLGEHESIDSISITWPSGINEVIADIPINQFIRVVENTKRFDVLGCTDSTSKNYNPLATINFGCRDKTTNINSEISQSIVKLYPNPASSQIEIMLKNEHLDYPVINVKLYTIEGVLLKTFEYNERQIYDIEGLSAGVYWVKLEGEKNIPIFQEKLIISK